MLNISKFLGKIIKNSSQRELDQLKLFVQKINDLEPKFKTLTSDDFQSKTKEFRSKILSQIGLLLETLLEPEKYRFFNLKMLQLGPPENYIFFFSGPFPVSRLIFRHTYLEDHRQIDPDRFWSPTCPKQPPTSQFSMLFKLPICIQSVIYSDQTSR